MRLSCLLFLSLFSLSGMPLEEDKEGALASRVKTVQAMNAGAHILCMEDPGLSENLQHLEDLDLLQPASFSKVISSLKDWKEAAAYLSSMVVGGSSAYAWATVMSANQSIILYLYPHPDEDSYYVNTTSFQIPVALMMAFPGMEATHENVQFLRHAFQGKKKYLKNMPLIKKGLHLANLAFSIQNIYNAYFIFANVSWGSRDPRVRDQTIAADYWFGATFMLTTFLNQLNNGSALVNRIENERQQRLNKAHLADRLKQSMCQQLQSQLRTAYDTLNTCSDEEVLQIRAHMAALHRKAQSADDRKKATLITLAALMALGQDSEGTAGWDPQEKPLSLKISEQVGGFVGGTLLPWAIFASYWAYDEDNRFDVSADNAYTYGPMDDPKAWAYASTLGAYLSVVGYFDGRELVRKVWSDWTGKDLNLYRAAPEPAPQNVRGVRAITRLLTYGVSNILVVPVAGMSTQIMATAGFIENYQQARLVMLSVMQWAVSFHGPFDQSYQNLISTLAGWRQTDPIGSARDDLKKTLITLHDHVGTLEHAEVQNLARILEELKQQKVTEDVARVYETAETSFSGIGTPETVGSPSSRSSGSERSSEGMGSPQGSLNAPLLGDHERSWEDAAEDRTYLLEEEEGELPPSWWGRTKAWLVGKPVPERLKHLVDQIYAPADPVPSSSEA